MDAISGLFHIHTRFSDGELSIPEVAALAKGKKVKIVSILDHACISGCVELFNELQGSDISVVMGYEHSIGDTDVAVLGIPTILPPWWSIGKLASEVHREGGKIVYLHPTRGNGHLDELAYFLAHDFVDGWEWKNNLDAMQLSPDQYDAPSFWGCDLHDKEEITKIPFGGMQLPSFLHHHLVTGDTMSTYFGYEPLPHEEFVFSFGRCNIRIAEGWVKCRIDFTIDWGWDNRLDGNGDCIEIAIARHHDSAFAEMATFSTGNDGFSRTNYLLDQTGLAMMPGTASCYSIKLHAFGRRRVDVEFALVRGRFAISIGSGKLMWPSSRRCSWPSPVWPPRNERDMAIVS